MRNLVHKNNYHKGGSHRSKRDYNRKDMSWVEEVPPPLSLLVFSGFKRGLTFSKNKRIITV